MSGFASEYSGVYGCGLIVVLIVMVFSPDPSPCQPSSAHDRAGVDVPRLTGDRGRSITCKEDRDVRDLNRIEATRHWREPALEITKGHPAFLRDLRQAQVARARAHRTRTDRVRGDPGLRDLERETLRERDEPAFARGVCRAGRAPMDATIDAMLITRPQRFAIIAGSVALQRRYGAVRFVASVRSQVRSEKSATGRGSIELPTPALFTRTSI